MPQPTPEVQKRIDAYIEQLSPKEKEAMEIARRILGTSFDLEQSIGFKKYSQKP